MTTTYVRYSRSVMERNDAGEPAVRSLCQDGYEEAQFAGPCVTRAITRPALDEVSQLAESERRIAVAERGFSGVEVELLDGWGDGRDPGARAAPSSRTTPSRTTP